MLEYDGISLIQPIPAYSRLFKPIPAYSSPFQPIPAYSPIPNLESKIPNLQFEMLNCAFYPPFGILSVSSLLLQKTFCNVAQYTKLYSGGETRYCGADGTGDKSQEPRLGPSWETSESSPVHK